MSDFAAMLLAGTSWKTAVLASGTAFGWMGYHLLRAGVDAPAEGIEGAWDQLKLTVRRSPAGVLFALFGAVVVGITAARGVDIKAPYSLIERPLAGEVPP